MTRLYVIKGNHGQVVGCTAESNNLHYARSGYMHAFKVREPSVFAEYGGQLCSGPSYVEVVEACTGFNWRRRNLEEVQLILSLFSVNFFFHDFPSIF